jgi:F-type H+-transporting ATPase subunit a
MARRSTFSSLVKFAKSPLVFLALAAFLCMATGPTAWAASSAWTRCQSDDRDARIAGCTEIIARGSREAKRNLIVAYVNRSGAYRVKGDVERAIADLDNALKLQPKSGFILTERASIHLAKDDFDRAIADYARALQLDQNLTAAYSGRAKAYLATGDLDKAIADFDQAIKRDPRLASAYDGRGLAFFAKGDFDKALADFSEAVTLEPRFAAAFLDRARVYQNKQDLDRAKQDLEAAVKLDPQLGPAREALDKVNKTIAENALPAAPATPASPAAKAPQDRIERPSPLASTILFRVGPASITRPVVTTWAIMLALTICAWLMTRRLQQRRDRSATIVEVLVTGVMQQIEEVLGADPRPYLPVIGTIFIFLVAANLSGVLPGAEAPTSKLETPAALALVVFASVHYFGVRAQGLLGYLASFAKPRLIMLPLNILSQVTRTFSLMIRLFGNVMSGEFVIALVVALSGLFVPIPLMVLEILVGIVQAYIFTVLATVFIGAAIGAVETG